MPNLRGGQETQIWDNTLLQPYFLEHSLAHIVPKCKQKIATIAKKMRDQRQSLPVIATHCQIITCANRSDLSLSSVILGRYRERICSS